MTLTNQEQVKLMEIEKTLQRLFDLYRDDRNAYSDAVRRVARNKAPGSTPQERRRFLSFALSVYDEAKRNGA